MVCLTEERKTTIPKMRLYTLVWFESEFILVNKRQIQVSHSVPLVFSMSKLSLIIIMLISLATTLLNWFVI